MSTPHSPRPSCARGWAGAPGAAGTSGAGSLAHTLFPAWHYPGTEWVGKGKDGCGWAQLPHTLLVLTNL